MIYTNNFFTQINNTKAYLLPLYCLMNPDDNVISNTKASMQSRGQPKWDLHTLDLPEIGEWTREDRNKARTKEIAQETKLWMYRVSFQMTSMGQYRWNQKGARVWFWYTKLWEGTEHQMSLQEKSKTSKVNLKTEHAYPESHKTKWVASNIHTNQQTKYLEEIMRMRVSQEGNEK